MGFFPYLTDVSFPHIFKIANFELAYAGLINVCFILMHRVI